VQTDNAAQKVVIVVGRSSMPRLISWLAQADAQLLRERAQARAKARELVEYLRRWQV
jgi:hypothetical protein